MYYIALRITYASLFALKFNLCYLVDMALDLNDLKPKEAELELSERPGKKYILKKVSLATQIWMENTFGKERIEKMWKNTDLGDISNLGYYLLKDKSDFASLNDFQEAIVTQADRMALVSAILTNVGISQPILDDLNRGDAPKKDESPVPPTGANSTT